MTLERHRGLTEQAATAAIDQACRMLRLPTIRAQFPDLAEAAARDQMSYRGFLAELHDGRVRRPGPATLRTAHQGGAVPPGEVAAGLRLRGQREHRRCGHPHPGDLRMGQEGPAALPDRGFRHRQVPYADRAGHRGRHGGFRVRRTLVNELVNELVEAADEEILTKTIARYGRVDLLCIDELGYMELDRRGAELPLQVLTEREEKNSVAIASNESFGGWTGTYTDPRLCAAIVDRLTFNGAIIETGTESYRLAHTKTQQRLKAVP